MGKRKDDKKRQRKKAKREAKREAERQAEAHRQAVQDAAALAARVEQLTLAVHELRGELRDARVQLSAELKAVRGDVREAREQRARPPNRPPPNPPGTEDKALHVLTPPRPTAAVAGRAAVVPTEIPPHRKIFIHARYKSRELSFHEQLWREMGLQITRDPTVTDWTVRWSMRLNPGEWSGFQSWQKTNFIPGIQVLIRKDNLHRAIVAMQRRHGEAAFDFWPRSFNLPDEWFAFQQHAAVHPELPWILKPPAAACGRKIQVFPNAAAISMTPDTPWIRENRPLAQEYLDTPLLDGHKYTFRIYVVVTGVDPLRVYVYKDGLCRIASRKYNKDPASFSDHFVHLDSIDINDKNSEPLNLGASGVETEGLRSSVWRVLRHLEKSGSIASAQSTWDEICSVVVRSILCAEGEMLSSVRKFVKHRNTCFDLLGYDILLDARTYKPFILEINHSPSMAPLTDMENEIKSGMLRDYFSLADLALAHRERLREMVMAFLASVQKRRVAGEVEYQLEDFLNMHQDQLLQVTRLSAFDVYTLVNAHLEMQRKGGFECVFPCADMLERYGRFYKHNRNVLHQVWNANKLTVREFL